VGGSRWLAKRAPDALVARRQPPTELPSIGGSWGDLQERIRRVLRLRERAVRESDTRLQDFLAALQASPNGVVLLDADKRIEWFNQTASDHFGLDSPRDLLQHFGNLVRDPGFAAYFTAGDFRHDVQMPGRNSTASRPINLSVHLHPYARGPQLAAVARHHRQRAGRGDAP